MVIVICLVESKKRGFWSQWSEWDENCSVTCGIGVRRRARICNTTGIKKAKSCKGNAGEMKNCDMELTCPVEGGWSEWVSWDCSVSCGGGVGSRRRSCTKPRPMFGGKDCVGESEGYGRCNSHKCADQVYTLSPETSSLLLNVKKINLSFEKKEGSFVRIPCNPEALQRVFAEYPGTILIWTKNGQLLQLALHRMRLSLTELVITGLKVTDNGVYMCSVHYAPSVVRPLSVATIAIFSTRPDIEVPAGEPILLVCYGVHLEKVFGRLSRSWSLDGKELINLKYNDSYEISKASSNMTGVWTCRMKDEDTSQVWTTNSIRVLVSTNYNSHEKLFIDKNVLLLSGITLLSVVLCSTVYVVFKMNSARRKFFRDYVT